MDNDRVSMGKRVTRKKKGAETDQLRESANAFWGGAQAV